MKEALFYKSLDHQLECLLCPHHCLLKNGQKGICQVRYNDSGKLYSETYGFPAAINMDPIEKKPLYHFFPRKNVLSIGTLGCNMKCFYCQNSDISQSFTLDGKANYVSAEEIVSLAKGKNNNIGIAYTYNEPTVFYEYMYDIARKIKQAGLKNIMVSNGFIEKDALSQINEFIDAYNIDIKGFTEHFYKKHTLSSLKPVLENIQYLAKSGVHLELTNLLIPGLNTSKKNFTQMVRWILNETGPETVLHLSRYFPSYNSHIPATSMEILQESYFIAREYLHYVYLGNIREQGFSDTYCYNCKTKVISRNGYEVRMESTDDNGNCINCGTSIIRYLN